MKILKLILFQIIFIALSVSAFSQTKQPYILEHEKDIAKIEPGTHNGGGNTTGYSFLQKLIA